MTTSETSRVLYWRNAYEELVRQTGRDLNDGLGLDPRKTHPSPLSRHQGQDEATSTLAVIARIREVTGLGHRPMLSELPEAIASILKSRSLAHAARHAEDDVDHLSNMLFNSISDAVYATNDGVVFNLKRFIKTLGQRGFAITAAAPQPPRQDDRDERIAALESTLKPFAKAWALGSREFMVDGKSYRTASRKGVGLDEDGSIQVGDIERAFTALQAKGAK